MGQTHGKPQEESQKCYAVKDIITMLYGKDKAQGTNRVLKKFGMDGENGLSVEGWENIKRDRQGEVLQNRWVSQIQCLIKVSNRAKEEGWKYCHEQGGWDMKVRRKSLPSAPEDGVKTEGTPPPYTTTTPGNERPKLYPSLRGRGWVCRVCGTQNTDWAQECVHCGAQRPEPVAPVHSRTRVIQVNNPNAGQAGQPPTVTQQVVLRTWTPWSADTLMALIQNAPDPVAKPAAFCRFVTQLLDTHEAAWQDGEDLCRHKMTLTMFNQFMNEISPHRPQGDPAANPPGVHPRHIDSRPLFINQLREFCQRKQQERGSTAPIKQAPGQTVTEFYLNMESMMADEGLDLALPVTIRAFN
ncbi:uncharacterized protein LOC143960887 [Lithobates pipiens]